MRSYRTWRHVVITPLVLTLVASSILVCGEGTRDRCAVIAYVHGEANSIEKYHIQKLTHVIYSFLHLRGNALAMRSPRDKAKVAQMVGLKRTYPTLKVLLSLGGWGGCEMCSDVFSTTQGRREFAESVNEILHRYHADGVDLDWEYPSIQGYPGHRYTPEDTRNFTLLIRELRKTLGDTLEVSFATGGFAECLRNSVEWREVIPLVDRVNVMTYDLVNGNSTVTGHHTSLMSSPQQQESTDNAVRLLDSMGVPRTKIVIGAAFYARIWQHVNNENNGLFQRGTFKKSIGYKDLGASLPESDGFREYWDTTAQAPYRYSSSKEEFATFDDRLSVALKTRYVLEKGLGGIMFWELSGDQYENGLLEAIDRVRHGRK